MVTLDNFLRNLTRENLEQASTWVLLKVEDYTLNIHLDPHRENRRSMIYNGLRISTIELGTLGSQQEIIYSLMHEIGHFLSNQTLSFEEALELKHYIGLAASGTVKSYILEREVLAWEAGYEYFISHGIPVPKGYSRTMIRSLSTYVLDTEEKEYWINTIGRRVAIIAFKEERQ